MVLRCRRRGKPFPACDTQPEVHIMQSSSVQFRSVQFSSFQFETLWFETLTAVCFGDIPPDHSLKMIGLVLASYRADSIPCSLNTCAFTAAHACMSPQPTSVWTSLWTRPRRMCMHARAFVCLRVHAYAYSSVQFGSVRNSVVRDSDCGMFW